MFVDQKTLNCILILYENVAFFLEIKKYRNGIVGIWFAGKISFLLRGFRKSKNFSW